jgi:hypothetical protein
VAWPVGESKFRHGTLDCPLRYDARMPRPLYPIPKSFYISVAVLLLLVDIVAVNRAAGSIVMVTLFCVVGGASVWARKRGLHIAHAFFLSVVIATCWLFPLLLFFKWFSG